jgi:hypothetical protein
MATSVTQYGMTFTFDGDYTVGQFANGDYYVVAPGSPGYITAITPNYSTGRNGVEINPNASGQGFDDRAAGWDAGRVASLPIELISGRSIVKATSDGHFVGTPDVDYDDDNRSYLETVSVLTVLAAAPSESSFRPPYCGAEKPVVPVSDINLSLLPSLTSPGSAPAIATILRRFERIQLDHRPQWFGEQIRPKQHSTQYGGFIAKDNGDALARLLTNISAGNKELLATYICQYGIDQYYAIKNGSLSWTPANGGHCQGRKMIVVLTAYLLEDSTMKTQIKEWSKGTPSSWKWPDDTVYQLGKPARVILWGQDGTQANYVSDQVTLGSGSRTVRDPWGWIDGGETPGGVYQAINDPVALTCSLICNHIPELIEIWGNPSISQGWRTRDFGTWTRPDPQKSITATEDAGVNDCVGRYPSRHGVFYDSSYYTAFIKDFYDERPKLRLLPPLIEVGGDVAAWGELPEANISTTVTITPFNRVIPASCTSYWTGETEFTPGSHPYITSNVQVWYTLDGTVPVPGVNGTLLSGTVSFPEIGEYTLMAVSYDTTETYETSPPMMAEIDVTSVANIALTAEQVGTKIVLNWTSV